MKFVVVVRGRVWAGEGSGPEVRHAGFGVSNWSFKSCHPYRVVCGRLVGEDNERSGKTDRAIVLTPSQPYRFYQDEAQYKANVNLIASKIRSTQSTVITNESEYVQFTFTYSK